MAAGSMLVRDRLLEQLEARWRVPLALVSAPAGYGKTTLLAQAMTANAKAAVGIDLYLACSSDMTAASALGDGLCLAVEGPVAPQSPNDRIDDPVQRVVDALWRRSPQQVALLIDDVQEIPASSEAARLLDAVIASTPTNAHVVLAGRPPPSSLLARLEGQGPVVRVDQADLAFTDAEVAEFAALRGVPGSTVARCGGWPALAEMCATAADHPNRDDTPIGTAGDYVGQEILSTLPAASRRALALLAHIGPFDHQTARAVIGPDADPADPADLLAGIPLVTQPADGEWSLHPLWTSLLEREASPTEIAEARRQAGTSLLRRGRASDSIGLLIEAEAWHDLTAAFVKMFGVVHPPVARDVLRQWLAQLPDGLRAEPAARLLAAVIHSESDARRAREDLEACAAAFRAAGQPAGELACLVQLGYLAWWAEDLDSLAVAATRVIELEAEGLTEVVPLAPMARATLFGLENDGRSRLAELNRILPGSVNDAWWGIVTWARAICLLELGHTGEARTTAEQALAYADLLHAPLAEMTRLLAMWFQGEVNEALDAFPAVLRRISASGYRVHTALIAALAAGAHAYLGQDGAADSYLADAQLAAKDLSEAPLVEANLTAAEAAVAVTAGDEGAATHILTAHVAQRPAGQGISAMAHRRHLALFYVLVPSTRPVWDKAELGPIWSLGRGLARALTAVRQGHSLPAETPSLDDVGLVQAHLPASWVAELAVAAVAAGRQDGWRLLERTWPATRATVVALAEQAGGPLRSAAREAVGRLAAPPDRKLELRLLGPVELRAHGALVDAPDWRRERVRTLLVYLALHRTVSRRQLADDLWPNLDHQAQSRNLRVTLTYLLRVLEPQRNQRDASFFIRQHGNNLTLHPSDWLTVDLWDFDTHCNLATDADRHGSPATALTHALTAIDLWRSEPTELGYESWAVAAVEKRRLRYAAIATRAGELLLARGDTDHAQRLADRALASDPWLDAAHRLTVAAHLARGDDLAARRAVNHYRQAIHDLGLDPDEATLMVERLLETIGTVPSLGSAGG